MRPVGSRNFPGSQDRVPTVTFTYSLLIKTSTMTLCLPLATLKTPFTHQAQPTAVPLHCLRAFARAVCSAGGGPRSGQLLLILQESAPLLAPREHSWACWLASVGCAVADTLASHIPSAVSGPWLRALLGLLNHPSLCSTCSREASQRPAQLLTLRPSLVPLV